MAKMKNEFTDTEAWTKKIKFKLKYKKYTEKLNICKEIKAGIPQFANMLKTKVFDSMIRESVSCRESQSAKKSIFDYAPSSTTAKDYMNLCLELEKGV